MGYDVVLIGNYLATFRGSVQIVFSWYPKERFGWKKWKETRNCALDLTALHGP